MFLTHPIIYLSIQLYIFDSLDRILMMTCHTVDLILSGLVDVIKLISNPIINLTILQHVLLFLCCVNKIRTADQMLLLFRCLTRKFIHYQYTNILL